MASGDLMVACLGYRGSANFTLPTGWALIAQETSGDTTVGGSSTTDTGAIASLCMAWIKRGASAPDLTFVRTGGDVVEVIINAYRNDRGSDYSLDSASSVTLAVASTTSGNLPLTTIDPDELIVAGAASGGSVGAAALGSFDASAGPTGVSGTTASVSAISPTTWRLRNNTGTATGADVALRTGDATKTDPATFDCFATSLATRRHSMAVAAFRIAVPITMRDRTGAGASASPLSWSHTVSAGTNAKLVVAVATKNPSSLIPVTSGITYGGVALTKAVDVLCTEGANYLREEIWYLDAPTVGTATIAVSTTNNYGQVGFSCTLFGVAAGAPEATGNNQTAANLTVFSVDVTSVSANALIMGAFATPSTGVPTITSGEPIADDRTRSTGSADDTRQVISYAIQPTAGLLNVDWTISTAFGRASAVGAAWAVASGGGGTNYDVSWSLGASAGLAASAITTGTAASALAQAAGIFSAAVGANLGAIALGGVAATSGAATGSDLASMALTGSAALTSTGVVGGLGAATLPGASSLAVLGNAGRLGASIFAASSGFGVTAAAGGLAVAVLPGAAAVAAALITARQASAALAVGSSMSFAAMITEGAAVALGATSTLSFLAGGQSAAGSLLNSAAFSGTATGQLQGLGSLTVAAGLSGSLTTTRGAGAIIGAGAGQTVAAGMQIRAAGAVAAQAAVSGGGLRATVAAVALAAGAAVAAPMGSVARAVAASFSASAAFLSDAAINGASFWKLFAHRVTGRGDGANLIPGRGDAANIQGQADGGKTIAGRGIESRTIEGNGDD